MKLSTRIITAVLLLAGSSGIVYAVSKHGDWGMTPEEKVEFVTDRVTRKLELTETQRQKFVALAESIATTLQEVKPQREQHMTDIEELLQEPVFDQARALQMIERKTRMVNERAPALIASLGEFVDSLNPEQKAQLQAFLQHRFEHGHRHRHKH